MPTLCNVTGNVYDREGNAVVGKVLMWEPSSKNFEGTGTSTFTADAVSVTTGAGGAIDFDIAPGNYTVYAAVAANPGRKAGNVLFTAGVPSEASANIAAIIDQVAEVTAGAVLEAAASAELAEKWASNPEDTAVETGPDKFSALHYSAKASAAESGAETAQAAAETARDDAQTAKTGAETARDEAQAAAAASDFAAITVSGDVTITRADASDGWFSASDPFASVALDPARADTSYSIGIQTLNADDLAAVGEIIAYDVATNGFKLKFTGSTDNVQLRWRIVEAV